MSRSPTLKRTNHSKVVGGVHEALIHESARKHATGEAIYLDDMVEPSNLLHIYIAKSTHAHADLIHLDVEPVRKANGVHTVLTAQDIPGTNDFGLVGVGDDPVFADGKVVFYGQALFAVVADSVAQARAAAALANIQYKALAPILTIEEALNKQSFISEPRRIETGNPDKALEKSIHRIKGRISTGGQDHFYLESQGSMAIPKEDGDVHIYCGTQDPTAVQHITARILGVPANSLTVEVRRMGGAFGGKETQATQFAAIVALAALKTGRAIKCRLDRDDDMTITGKRHPYRIDYEVGFDNKGKIDALDMVLAQNSGHSHDTSLVALDRTLYHCDNAYFIKNIRVTGYSCKTNICSSTAFRGFGAPQAIVGIERVLDEIARYLQKDPLEIRKLNLYGSSNSNETYYGWTLTDNILDRIVGELEECSDYEKRRLEVEAFNASSPWLKKGIAFMPLKFGVGFTRTFLNQAGALIHIYQDGSIQLNHGGTEMGQGVFIKVAQVVAEELQVDINRIKHTSTTTDKVPNTTTTAASTGSDLNGAAASDAARKLRKRLTKFAAQYYDVELDDIIFCDNKIIMPGREIGFAELVLQAYMNQVPLSATGYYRNTLPKVNEKTLKGRPYHYYAYGGAVAEVIVDTLTGETKILRIDTLQDVGKSLNPAIDLGQLEGGIVQGCGWLTSEELYWDEVGQLKTHAPSTYKIPVCSDRPAQFNMHLVNWSENREETIFRSKAIGEPPLMLSVAVFNAIADAIASIGHYRYRPHLDAPATPERILKTIEALRTQIRNNGTENCSYQTQS